MGTHPHSLQLLRRTRLCGTSRAGLGGCKLGPKCLCATKVTQILLGPTLGGEQYIYIYHYLFHVQSTLQVKATSPSPGNLRKGGKTGTCYCGMRPVAKGGNRKPRAARCACLVFALWLAVLVLACQVYVCKLALRGRSLHDPQGSLHFTPEHCLVNGIVPLFWWKKPCFKWAKCIF